MGKILIRYAMAVLGLLAGPFWSSAQLTVNTGLAPEKLVNEHLLGEGIMARNVKFTGDVRALGVFENPEGRPGFEKGILISTGQAVDAAGPNDNPKTSTSLGKAGSKDLYTLAKGRTFDAAILEFEFMAARDSVTLKFMYASEEYNDYVGSTFSDAFMIRISGPGFPNGRDLGMIPGTSTPINVNTVNYNTNGQYYDDNNPFTLAGRLNEKREAELDAGILKNFEYDGMTKVLSVGTQVKPRETYRIQIAIADAGDGNIDSGLFIEAGSFQSIEQYRWVLRREKIAEKRRLDSLARVAFVEDSLAREQAIADSLEAIQMEAQRLEAERLEQERMEQEGEMNGEEGDESEDWEDGGEDLMEAEAWEGEETDESEEEAGDAEYVEDEAPVDETVSAAKIKYRSVIRYAREDFLVPDESQGMLNMYATYVKEHPGSSLGVYVPGKDEIGKLRYDMVRAELFKAGLAPDRIFQNDASFLPAENVGGVHRVEIVVRLGE